ncbi:MAG: pyridoxine 5'-phosphate synthase [Gemmatimonadales bacterium]|jgi:pyridoxine 5-phosphate synthase|nr:MAG: pyridoxine 5'-phosphate synthase [Gemmatimonadales bacterium]
MTRPRLYVNIDHVATVREARRTDEPDPLAAARAAMAGGADGITVHLREDRRHIQDADVIAIAESLPAPLNFELALSDDIIALACQLRPLQVTLVPERREEVTTEGGLRVSSRDARLRNAIRRLDEAGCQVSLFIDPVLDVIDAAKDLGVPAIELHTGEFSHRWREGTTALDTLRQAARHASELGLAVHAGHGLTYLNVQGVASVPEIEELNIGHSIVSRAMFEGLEAAVREMRRLMTDAR